MAGMLVSEVARSAQNAVRAVTDQTLRKSESAFRPMSGDILKLSSAARSTDPWAGLTFRLAGDTQGLVGGHLPKQILVDQHQRRWLVKEVPAGQEYRGLSDAVGSDLFKALGIPTPEVRAFDQVVGGKRLTGTIQPMVEHTGKVVDARKLSPEQTDDLLQSQVGRWLISDHDGKPENFLLMKDHHVQAIDLGQMYRFFPGDSLDRKYQPNADKPLYRSMWKAYVTGKIDLDFSKGLEVVSKAEALPDEQFVKMLRPYAEARYRQGGPIAGLPKVEDFLQAALSRKQTLRQDMLGFYDSLAKERGTSGLAEAMGQPERAEELGRVGLAPVQKLHPEVAAAWAQSKANAARYREESLQLLTKKLGSRAQAEAEYGTRLQQAREQMNISANYQAGPLARALQEGRVRSLYDLPRREQVAQKGEAYLARREKVDRTLGLKDSNPLYVSIGGNPKYERDVASKYGNVEATFRTEALAPRTLFSEGNHFHFGDLPQPLEAYRSQRFTWYDAPHLLVNRLLKEANPKEASHLLEGTVFGGINPSQTISRLQIKGADPEAQHLADLARQRGLQVA